MYILPVYLSLLHLSLFFPLSLAYKRLDGTMDCCSNNSLTDLCFSYMKTQGRNSREREVTHTHTQAGAFCDCFIM